MRASVMMAGAAALGNAVLLRRVIAAGAPPPPMVAEAMKVLGNMGLAAIVTLWMTGVPLAILTGAFAGGGALFQLKLLGAAALLGLISYMTLRRAQAAAGKPPLALAQVKVLAMSARWLLVLVVILAVFSFH
jgi:hypothetical protein